ncbi:Crp/Fnr family transcriptional regulator, partial [Dysosmobacter welbionis]
KIYQLSSKRKTVKSGVRQNLLQAVGPQLLVQLVLNLSQLAVHGAAAVAAAPGALIRRIHAGAQIPAFSHGLHQVIEAGAGQIRRQPAAARRSADHLHQSGLLQLFQDFIGKGLGEEFILCDLSRGMQFSIQQCPQDAQGVICLPGNDQCRVLLLCVVLLIGEYQFGYFLSSIGCNPIKSLAVFHKKPVVILIKCRGGRPGTHGGPTRRGTAGYRCRCRGTHCSE